MRFFSERRSLALGDSISNYLLAVDSTLCVGILAIDAPMGKTTKVKKLWLEKGIRNDFATELTTVASVNTPEEVMASLKKHLAYSIDGMKEEWRLGQSAEKFSEIISQQLKEPLKVYVLNEIHEDHDEEENWNPGNDIVEMIVDDNPDQDVLGALWKGELTILVTFDSDLTKVINKSIARLKKDLDGEIVIEPAHFQGMNIGGKTLLFVFFDEYEDIKRK
jgi:hypothetical protein